MTDETGYLACRCGQCRIALCDPDMRYRSECLCVDCRQRGLISASRRPGNELPPAVAAYERGIDLYYFTNALKVDDASFDGGHTISVNADSCRVTVPSVMPSKLIGFGGDIPVDKCEAIRQRDTRPLVMSLEAEIDEPHMVELLAATAPVPERFSREGRTFEALCAAKNNTRIDNAFFEESRAGRPRL